MWFAIRFYEISDAFWFEAHVRNKTWAHRGVTVQVLSMNQADVFIWCGRPTEMVERMNAGLGVGQ